MSILRVRTHVRFQSIYLAELPGDEWLEWYGAQKEGVEGGAGSDLSSLGITQLPTIDLRKSERYVKVHKDASCTSLQRALADKTGYKLTTYIANSSLSFSMVTVWLWLETDGTGSNPRLRHYGCTRGTEFLLIYGSSFSTSGWGEVCFRILECYLTLQRALTM